MITKMRPHEAGVGAGRPLPFPWGVPMAIDTAFAIALIAMRNTAHRSPFWPNLLNTNGKVLISSSSSLHLIGVDTPANSLARALYMEARVFPFTPAGQHRLGYTRSPGHRASLFRRG
jgi:hypothetical protein